MNKTQYTRRGVLVAGLQAAAGVTLAGVLPRASGQAQEAKPMQNNFDISLAAWSVHRMFFAGKLQQIDMPKLCREEFGLGGLELVNTFFPSPNYNYLKELSRRAKDQDVKILLIMVDAEGELAHSDPAERRQAIRNHRKWLDCAAVLGCHSMRCNTGHAAPGDTDAVSRCADSLAQLAEYAKPDGLNVIVENHGGLSADPASLIAVLEKVNDPHVGTLPDFGNFPAEVDRYDAVRRMMPYAKAVSAKCHDFGENGDETKIDYAKMMEIVLGAGYRGFVGIEYEGDRLGEKEGVLACKKLLERFQKPVA